MTEEYGNPRRVAILTSSLSGSGQHLKALYIATELLERGYEVDLLLDRLICHYPDRVPKDCRIFFASGRGDAKTRENLERMAVVPQRFVSGARRWRNFYYRAALLVSAPRKQALLLMDRSVFRWAPGVAEYLNRERPDALLAMSPLATAAGTMSMRLAPRPVRVVASAHNKLMVPKWIDRARNSYPYADAVVGVSHGIARELAEIADVPRDRVHTIYNPVVSAELARKTREAIDHPWLDGSAPPVILAIGRLSAQKDFSTLLAAFARLLARRPARLIVLGRGHLQSRLFSQAQELRIVEHVDFPGFVENPYAFLARASLFVLSSRWEGLPTVLIEAMACGCPVVSTDCEFGPNEILENGRWGELVPVGDPTALAEAMARALDVSPDRDALQERAAFFNVERAVDRYEEFLFGGT